MKKSCLLVFAAALAFLAGGCSGVEPEKRCYPLVLAADYQDGAYQIIYGMPNLPASTGQEKEEETGTSPSLLSFQEKTPEEVQAAYEKSQDKYLDLGHLQAMILGDGLKESGKWRELMEYYRSDPAVGEDIYLFLTEDIGAAMEVNGSMSSSLGEYLTGIYENRPGGLKKRPATLRKAYERGLSGEELPGLPRLTVSEQGIRIS